MASQPLLFSPIALRGITLKNRVVVSPMCQYSAHDGLANDWHFVHLGQMDTGWLVPHDLSLGDIRAVQARWREAALRSLAAGFEVLEMHSADGYLGHEFLSPLANKRTDQYGGDLRGRMRYTLELADVLRA